MVVALAVVLVGVVVLKLSQCSNPHLCLCSPQDARKAQLENHEPEDEEEDLDKDLQDSGQLFVVCSFSLLVFIVVGLWPVYRGEAG